MSDHDWLTNLTDADVLDIRERSCELAEAVLEVFETQYPDDKRPRRAIELARGWLAGTATKSDCLMASDAAQAASVEVYKGSGPQSAASYAARAATCAGRACGLDSPEQATYMYSGAVLFNGGAKGEEIGELG